MIPFFPIIYDDELLYSSLSRYHLHSGNLTYRQTSRQLFVNCASKPNYELFNSFNNGFVEFLEMKIGEPIGDIILNHTLIKHYSRFFVNRKELLKAISRADSTIINTLPLPEYGKRYLKYCPICVEEQRMDYGECFFTCSANLNGVNICYRHGCKLIKTDLSTESKTTPAFVTAEETVPRTHKIELIKSNGEIEVAKYIVELFKCPLDDVEISPVGTFLKEKLQAPYICARGEVMYRTLFWNDFLAFYDGVDLCNLTELWQMSKLFQNKRKATNEIALVAFFLGIPIQELASPKPIRMLRKDVFDEAVFRLHKDGLNYMQISKRLGSDYDYTKSIGEGRRCRKI